MTVEELYQEIESTEEIVKPIPSESESEVDVSDIEEPALNVESQNEKILISESDESESDLPLTTVRNLIMLILFVL